MIGRNEAAKRFMARVLSSLQENWIFSTKTILKWRYRAFTRNGLSGLRESTGSKETVRDKSYM